MRPVELRRYDAIVEQLDEVWLGDTEQYCRLGYTNLGLERRKRYGFPASKRICRFGEHVAQDIRHRERLAIQSYQAQIATANAMEKLL